MQKNRRKPRYKTRRDSIMSCITEDLKHRQESQMVYLGPEEYDSCYKKECAFKPQSRTTFTFNIRR